MEIYQAEVDTGIKCIVMDTYEYDFIWLDSIKVQLL